MVKIVAVAGPPCSGKSTYARALGGVVFSSGRLIPPDPKIREILDAGGMHPSDEAVTELVRLELERLSSIQLPLVIDGFPRCGNQLRWLFNWCYIMSRPFELHLLVVPAVLCREWAKRCDRHNGHDHRSALWYAVQFHELIREAHRLGVTWKAIYDEGETKNG